QVFDDGSTTQDCAAARAGCGSGWDAATPGVTYYYDGGTCSHSTCPAESLAPPTANDLEQCLCAPGETGSDPSACTPCDPQTFKNTHGPEACAACPGVSTSATGAAVCTCPPGSSGPDGSACDACDEATFKNVSGPSSCAACPAFTLTPPGATSLSGCVCQPGYNASTDGVECVGCPAGTYKSANGTGSCNACPAGTNSSLASALLADCSCVAGYVGGGDGVTCATCDAGTYKAAPGVSPCVTCPNGTTSANGSTSLLDCFCLPGMTDAGGGGGECVACAAGTYGPGGVCSICPGNSRSLPGSVSLQDCTCLTGHTAASNGVACTACEPGTYKNWSGTGNCTSCHGSSANSSPGSVSPAACLCFPGFTSQGPDCLPCPADFYKNVSGPSACVGCEAGRGSLLGSSACFCPPGSFQGRDGVCQLCAAATYKASYGSEACSSCPTNAVSPTASVAISACVCPLGYSGTANTDCTGCLQATFKPELGAGTCTACPSHTTSATASPALTNCTCLAGYTAASDVIECAACGGGTYKVETGTGACEACPAGTSSADGSAFLASCIPCAAGTYGTTLGVGACETCPAGTTSAVGSDSVGDCTCKPGYAGEVDGVACVACDAWAYKEAGGVGTCSPCPPEETGQLPASSPGGTECVCRPNYDRDAGGCVLRGDVDVVTFTAVLQIALGDMALRRGEYITSVAATFGEPEHAVAILSETAGETAERRRRLLADTTRVETQVTVPRERISAPGSPLDTLKDSLADSLPGFTVITVVSVTLGGEEYPPPFPVGGIVGIVLGSLLLLCFCIFCLVRVRRSGESAADDTEPDAAVLPGQSPDRTVSSGLTENGAKYEVFEATFVREPTMSPGALHSPASLRGFARGGG
ncbi:hypothetical protein T484DRAFT_3332358, partial [Baffinella frigidus]